MRKKYFVIFALALVFLAIVILFSWTIHVWSLNLPGSGSITDKISAISIDDENLLILSIRVNEASSSLAKKIKSANLNLPRPVELSDSDFLYKTPGASRSWIGMNNGVINIVIYRDVLSYLNSDEIVAFALHDLGHFVLGHIDDNPMTRKNRNIQMEKDADKFAVDSGVSPKILISTINKLVPEGDWKSERIASLVGALNNSERTP